MFAYSFLTNKNFCNINESYSNHDTSKYANQWPQTLSTLTAKIFQFELFIYKWVNNNLSNLLNNMWFSSLKNFYFKKR